MADLTVGSVAAPDKSPIQKWINRLVGVARNSPQHVQQGAQAFRQYSEAGLTGAALAAVEVAKPQHSDKIQLGTAVVGAVGAVLGATQDFAVDLRNVGSNAFSIFTYRKGLDMLRKKRLAVRGEVFTHGETFTHGEGEIGEDPIVTAARNL